jgi:acetylornithine deacetylase/succinyl-diaminopimelate desuccinylase-like protein
MRLDELIVAEPTACAPVYGHKGCARVRLTVEGVAAHSSRPEQGRNAISAAAHVILAMDAEHARLQAAPPTPLGPPTLSVTLVDGGRGINVVPDACRLSLDRRVVAGEDAAELCRELTGLARRACPLPVSAERLLALGAGWPRGRAARPSWRAMARTPSPMRVWPTPAWCSARAISPRPTATRSGWRWMS